MVLNTIECRPAKKNIPGLDGKYMDCRMYLWEGDKGVTIDVEEVFTVEADGTAFSVMSGRVGEEDVIWIKPDDQIRSFFTIRDRKNLKGYFPKEGKDIIIGIKK